MKKERRFSGAGSDTDIVISSARAYTSALNKMLSWNNFRRTSSSEIGNESGGINDAVAVQSANGGVQIA